jgi:2Fe-2S ferredoxin
VARITFVLQDGSHRTVEGSGGTLMELGRNAGVRGILGECGGACSCGTCHIRLTDEGFRHLGVATSVEMNVLEFEPDATTTSRLSCQITLTEALDGLTVNVVGS